MPTCQRCVRGDFGFGSKKVMLWPRNVCDALRAADRLLDAVRERVRQRADERQPVVERRDHVRVLAEAALEDVAAALPEEAVEHAVAAAQHGLLVQLEGQADARHEVGLRRLVEPARLAVDAGEGQPAADVEGADRNFRRRVERVTRARGRLDGLHGGRRRSRGRSGCSPPSSASRTRSAGRG